ncbi:MAG: twin-arginine translocation signal domain-containing protein [Bacteroidales bacterium]|nr:twin-arginine translocation signal domain-containing protein [Bacteroidales bacterium]
MKFTRRSFIKQISAAGAAALS